MNVVEQNKRIIDERISAGLDLLRKRFVVTERTVDPALADPVIGGRPHHARRFDIAGLGNLLVMTVKEAQENQLSSFVITPYGKDLPLFSSDYVYSGERRFFLIELYDLAVHGDDEYQRGIGSITSLADSWNDMPDFPAQPCWYDDIRPVCIAKAPSLEQDETAVQRFLAALELYVEMGDSMPPLDENERAEKWRLNKGYADRLIDEGGVSTGLFTQALGAENTRRFFDEVFFAPACYAPSSKKARHPSGRKAIHMKLVIASDIHGSAKWCAETLRVIDEVAPDKVLLLGDLLYHGPRNPLPDDYAPADVAAMLNPLADRIIAVRGNCDAEVDQMMLDFPCMADFTWIVDGPQQLYCTHGHLWDPDNLPPLPAGSAFVYGHFHVKRNEAANGVRLFNPGSAGLPKDGTHSVGIYEDGRFEFRNL